ncbi:hypothetical protein [Chondromyces apiculatus]|nr:hypothetical protein [Chondromyces apiculatus]
MGDLAISFTELGPSEDAVWDAFARDLSERGVNRLLATSLGAIDVTSAQRRIIADALKQRKIAAAAVMDDRLSRGVVTAVTWQGVDIEIYAWSELREAILSLNVPPAEVDAVIDATIRLRAAATT